MDERDISHQHVFLIPQRIYPLLQLALLFGVLQLEFDDILALQLLGLPFQPGQFLIFSVYDEVGLLDLIIDLQQFVVFLAELVDIEVSVSLQVAVYLLDVLIFYDVLLQTQGKDGLCQFQLAADGLGGAVAEEIVRQVHFLKGFGLADVFEEDSAQIVFDLAVSHLEFFEDSSLDHVGQAFRSLFVVNFVVREVQPFQSLAVLNSMRNVVESHLAEVTIDQRQLGKREGLLQKVLQRGELSIKFHMIKDDLSQVIEIAEFQELLQLVNGYSVVRKIEAVEVVGKHGIREGNNYAVAGQVKRKQSGSYAFYIGVLTEVYMPETRVPAALQNHAIGLDVHIAQLQRMKGPALLYEINQMLVSGQLIAILDFRRGQAKFLDH